MAMALIVLAGIPAALLLAGMVVRVLVPLPSLAGRSVSAAYQDTSNTPLGRAIAPAAAAHPHKSGFHALSDAHDAFAARVLLARAAVRSLDLQYYIWNDDLSGTLLFQELRIAADRGVRVRLLLDDNVTAGLDPILTELNAHPGIEVRLFNPFVIRWPRSLGYLTDFRRLNRRMHNKSFTADNQATIIGGRNIGDEYMGASDGLLFVDLDVLAAGPIAQDVSHKFDLYWASGSAYPLERVVRSPRHRELKALSTAARRVGSDPAAQDFRTAIQKSTLLTRLSEGKLSLEWTTMRLIADDPAKAVGLAPPESLLFTRLRAKLGTPEKRLELVSSYFVPEKQGVEAFSAMVRSGVDVSILTNSLEATDVPIVHAGYAHRRKALLAAGVRLYEMQAVGSGKRKVRPTGGARISGMGSGSGSGTGTGTAVGGSATALHAKTFAIDGERVFVGSFNFDPRSERLNTEMALLIDSADLAQQIESAFESRVPVAAYEVKLSTDGKLYWIAIVDGKSVRLDTEPGTNFSQRAAIGILSFLPIEWLL